MIAVALAAILVPVSIVAQTTPVAAGLNLKALPTAFVLDDRGNETTGKLLRLDDEAVVLLVGTDERRFDTRGIARVSRRGDSLKNGAISGLIVGIGLNVLALATNPCRRCDEGWLATYMVVNTALYTAIGTAIDAAVQGRTTLYQAPSGRKTGTSAGRASIGLRFSW